MRTIFFVIVSLLAILWVFLSFYFFKLDTEFLVYENILFEVIFFVWIFTFGIFLWRFFAFENEDKIIKKKKTKPVKIEKEINEDNDNLKIVVWIWPKIEKLLKLNGINTIKELSLSWYDEVKIILERAWDNFKIINPRSWPYQAELANNKEWEKLKEYQDFLVWGVDVNEINK